MRSAFSKTGVGTPEYMSPEQATAHQRGAKRGFEHDIKVDIWSVGATLFELVTDQYPIYEAKLNVSTSHVAMNKIPSGKVPPFVSVI